MRGFRRFELRVWGLGGFANAAFPPSLMPQPSHQPSKPCNPLLNHPQTTPPNSPTTPQNPPTTPKPPKPPRQVDLNDAEPAFLKGHSARGGGAEMSPVKIVKNPDGSMQRAAMTQGGLAKERRELREQQQRTLMEAIPKDISRRVAVVGGVAGGLSGGLRGVWGFGGFVGGVGRSDDMVWWGLRALMGVGRGHARPPDRQSPHPPNPTQTH